MFESTKYRLILLTITISIVFLLSYGCSSERNEEIVAKVGSDMITVSEFEQRYSDYLFSTGITDNIINRRYILNNMIDEIVLLNYDNNDKILNSDEFKKTLEWRKNETILSFLKDREVYAKIEASDAEIRRAFMRVNEKIAARHIYASNKQEADDYYNMLKSGISFETLAKEAFTDSTLKNNGGYIGYFNWGEMDPAFEDAAYGLKVGEISEPVKTSTGYSIIQVTDRIPHPLLTENEYINKRSKLERAVKIRKKQPSEIEFINNAIDLSQVKINDNGVEKVFELINSGNLDSINETPTGFSGEICAEYESTAMTDADLFERIRNMPLSQRIRIKSPAHLKAAVKGLFLQDELLKKAEELGYDENEIVKEAIEDIRKDLIIQKKISEITYNADISDSLVQKFYDTNESFFIEPAQINVQEIIVEDKSIADDLYSRLESGENFGKLAGEYSIRRFSGENNGELGFANVSQFGNLAQTFQNAELNTLIGPIEIAGVYGIFKVLGKKESVKQSFSEVYDKVKAATRFKYSKKLVKDYLNGLYESIEISKKDTLLASIKIDYNTGRTQ